jgi:thiamine-phosphate pyrophosphorylase
MKVRKGASTDAEAVESDIWERIGERKALYSLSLSLPVKASTPPPDPMKPSGRFQLRGLYAISDGPRTDLIDVCAAALDGGAAILQYRDKTGDRDRRMDEAQALQDVCTRHRVPLIINDDVALALAVGAAGVHLGAGDIAFATARARLGPDAIIGVSCYDSLERARQFAAAGADYLAFGAFFPSPTKPAARRATPQLLRDARALGLPLVAIGGITVDNARVLVDTGAQMLAVISALFAAADVGEAARRFADLFEPRRS